MPGVTPGMWEHHDETTEVWPGRNWPLGATWSSESTNFAVYAPLARAAWLCLYDDRDAERQVLALGEQRACVALDPEEQVALHELAGDLEQVGCRRGGGGQGCSVWDAVRPW